MRAGVGKGEFSKVQCCKLIAALHCHRFVPVRSETYAKHSVYVQDQVRCSMHHVTGQMDALMGKLQVWTICSGIGQSCMSVSMHLEVVELTPLCDSQKGQHTVGCFKNVRVRAP